MRWVICAVVVLAFAPRAFADDLDILRGTDTVGPATFTKWSGFFFRRPSRLHRRQCQFRKFDAGAYRLRAARHGARRYFRTVKLADSRSGYDVEGNLRRLRRLQHTVGRSRHRREFATRPRIFPSPRHLRRSAVR